MNGNESYIPDKSFRGILILQPHGNGCLIWFRSFQLVAHLLHAKTRLLLGKTIDTVENRSRLRYMILPRQNLLRSSEILMNPSWNLRATNSCCFKSDHEDESGVKSPGPLQYPTIAPSKWVLCVYHEDMRTHLFTNWQLWYTRLGDIGESSQHPTNSRWARARTPTQIDLGGTVSALPVSLTLPISRSPEYRDGVIQANGTFQNDNGKG